MTTLYSEIDNHHENKTSRESVRNNLNPPFLRRSIVKLEFVRTKLGTMVNRSTGTHFSKLKRLGVKRLFILILILLRTKYMINILCFLYEWYYGHK